MAQDILISDAWSVAARIGFSDAGCWLDGGSAANAVFGNVGQRFDGRWLLGNWKAFRRWRIRIQHLLAHRQRRVEGGPQKEGGEREHALAEALPDLWRAAL